VRRNIFFLIREDPTKTHRPVEALRIALGLAAGEHAVTIALCERAALLLTEDLDDVIDADVLEKYLPSLKQLGIEFIVAEIDRESFHPAPGFTISYQPIEVVRSRIAAADAVLAFQ
jgi:hypothetical protein